MFQAVKGTSDLLSPNLATFRQVESKALSLAEQYGFSEIRTPVFEKADLFTRGLGVMAGLVERELWTFQDKHGQKLALRADITPCVVRAYQQHKLGRDSKEGPVKLAYVGPVFLLGKEGEQPSRQAHQFGVEVLGNASPALDAELIVMGLEFFERLGISGVSVEINSLGCDKCRPAYYDALREFFSARQNELCSTCKRKYRTHPTWTLSCPESGCGQLANLSPTILGYLCADCKAHFNSLKQILGQLDVEVSFNPRVVRDLEYYNRTVFRYVHEGKTLGVGGRYDGLVEQLGGSATPGAGFAIYLDEVVSLLEAPEHVSEDLDFVFLPEGPEAVKSLLPTALKLRRGGARVEVFYHNPGGELPHSRFTVRQADANTLRGQVDISDGEGRLNEKSTVERLLARLQHLLGQSSGGGEGEGRGGRRRLSRNRRDRDGRGRGDERDTSVTEREEPQEYSVEGERAVAEDGGSRRRKRRRRRRGEDDGARRDEGSARASEPRRDEESGGGRGRGRGRGRDAAEGRDRDRDDRPAQERDDRPREERGRDFNRDSRAEEGRSSGRGRGRGRVAERERERDDFDRNRDHDDRNRGHDDRDQAYERERYEERDRVEAERPARDEERGRGSRSRRRGRGARAEVVAEDRDRFPREDSYREVDERDHDDRDHNDRDRHEGDRDRDDLRDQPQAEVREGRGRGRRRGRRDAELHEGFERAPRAEAPVDDEYREQDDGYAHSEPSDHREERDAQPRGRGRSRRNGRGRTDAEMVRTDRDRAETDRGGRGERDRDEQGSRGRDDQDRGARGERGRDEQARGERGRDERGRGERGRDDQDRGGRGERGRDDQDRGGRSERGRDDQERSGRSERGRDDQDRGGRGERGRDDQDRGGRGERGRDDQDRGGRGERGRDDQERGARGERGRDEQDRSGRSERGRGDQDRGGRDDQDRGGRGERGRDDQERGGRGNWRRDEPAAERQEEPVKAFIPSLRLASGEPASVRPAEPVRRSSRSSAALSAADNSSSLVNLNWSIKTGGPAYAGEDNERQPSSNRRRPARRR